MRPSGYKEDTVYSLIPNNSNGSLSFTRASDAWRTDIEGLIQRVPWNLLQQSNAFSTSPWSLVGTPTLTANYAANPLTGANDAWRFQSASASNRVFQVFNGSLTTFSLYAKGTGIIRLRDSTDNYRADVVLTSSWQRVTLYIPASFTNVQITSDAGCDATIYGAQLVEGSSAQTYFPTTDRLNVPRLSYMYGSCPALLLEPQRTNLLPNQLSYNTATGVAYSTSVTDSPVIGLNSTRITKNEASGTLRYGNQICSSSALAGSTTYTISAYFKYDGYAVTTTMEYNNSLQWGGTSWNQIINIASTGVTLGSSSSCTGSVQNVGNGWYRVSVTITTGASISGGTPVSYLMQVASTLSTGQGFLQAAPQFEQGAYSTTTIITTGASATRIADTASKTGISSLIGQTEGVIFVDFYVNGIGANNINIYNNDRSPSTISTNAILYKPNGSIECQTFLGNGTFNTISISASTYTIGQRIKLAYRYKSGDFAVYINGIQKATSTSTMTFVGTKSQIYLDDNAVIYGYQESVHYNQFALFTTALTNAELVSLTT